MRDEPRGCGGVAEAPRSTQPLHGTTSNGEAQDARTPRPQAARQRCSSRQQNGRAQSRQAEPKRLTEHNGEMLPCPSENVPRGQLRTTLHTQRRWLGEPSGNTSVNASDGLQEQQIQWSTVSIRSPSRSNRHPREQQGQNKGSQQKQSRQNRTHPPSRYWNRGASPCTIKGSSRASPLSPQHRQPPVARLKHKTRARPEVKKRCGKQRTPNQAHLGKDCQVTGKQTEANEDRGGMIEREWTHEEHNCRLQHAPLSCQAQASPP
jgi:hypothetical protein